MPIYVAICFIFVVLVVFLYVLVQSMKGDSKKGDTSFFMAILIAALTISFAFLMPAAVLFGLIWAISYLLPERGL